MTAPLGMSAPYFVGVSYPSGHSREIKATTFEEVCDLAEIELAKPGMKFVTVYGDGYDVDSDQDGFFCCDDGLTEAERDVLEARGIS